MITHTRDNIFLFSTAFRPALGFTQSPIQWGLRAISPEAKCPGNAADHSPPPSTDVKNGEAEHPLNLYVCSSRDA
jgi:hypothetical protein